MVILGEEMDVDPPPVQFEQGAVAAEAGVSDGGIRIGDVYIPPPPLPACTFDPTGPRLIITKIENIFFKSYAGRKDLGPFHKNFTAIVGPNGSGKSNVIDAMLFVFGYRAQKIRSKKVGVLIHRSDSHPEVDSCSVRVHFQKIVDTGGESYIPVPGSEFVIGRTAYKDNSSTYEIDGKRTQFKKVSTLLRSYGIDLDHNRFLILQGEIEMIAMMKPKGTEHESGMLEYLEDIIGCNRFIEPIEMFAKTVEEYNDIRTERLNRVKVVGKEKDDLEIVRNEAVEFIKLENKIALMENTMYQAQLRDKEMEVQQAILNRDEVKQALETLAVEQEELKYQRTLKEKEHAEILAAYDKCAAAVEETDHKYAELERKDVVCRENVNISKGKVKKLAASLEAEEKKLADLQKQPAIHENEAEELEKKKTILESKKETEEKKLKEVLASIKKETESMQEEKAKHEEKLIELKKVVNENKCVMDLAQSELDMYVGSEKKEKSKLEELEDKHKKVVDSIASVKKSVEEAKVGLPVVEKKLADLKNRRQSLSVKEASLFDEVKTLRTKVEEAKLTMSASRNRGVIIQSLMEQQRLGHISGILGRLGDLGGIDEKYDVAISTVCGRLENIVTDTMTTAQKCVEYLKRSNKGYCTFIALDKMRRYESVMQQDVTKSPYPEKVARLFDLVKVNDQRVLPALYYALGDTLVARDLDQATRIGLHGNKRYRVVTLKGEVIDLSGTMSGGGGRVIRGRMGKSATGTDDITPKTVENMEKSLENVIKTANDVREERMAVDKDIIQAEKDLTSLQHSLAKNTSELSALKDHESQLSKQIVEQKPKVRAAAPDMKKVNEMTTKLEKAKKSYEKANGAAQEVEASVKKLHAEITAITKGKYGAVQKVVDKLSKDIDTIRTNINKCTAAAKTAVRNQKKTESKIKSLQEEMKEEREHRDSLLAEYKSLEEQATKVLDIKKNNEEELKKYAEQKKVATQEINEFKDKELKLKSNTIELKNTLKEKENAVKEKQDITKRIKANLSKLQLQKIDDEDNTPLTLPTLTSEELDEVSANAVSYEIGTLQAQMSKMKPNLSAIAEYKRKEELYKKKMEELEETTKKRDEAKKHHDDLRKQRLDEFMAGFKIITAKLKEVYQMITMGGDAELELVDSLDPFKEGIVFSVRPPKKSWKNITNLSGGEKTLSSLALVFALHYYKPTPFYVMDEIDAALDFKNVSIVGNYIKERTKNAQFIIISLRNNMFELSDRLVGIYKVRNCTSTVTVSPTDLAIVINQQRNRLPLLPVPLIGSQQERGRSSQRRNSGNDGPSCSAAGTSQQPPIQLPLAKSPGRPGRTAKSPGRPGHTAKSPSRPGRTAKSPGRPGRTAKSPGKPGRTAKSPSKLGHTAKSPGGSDHSANSPGGSDRSPNSPGGSDRSPDPSGEPSHSCVSPRKPVRSAKSPGKPARPPKSPRIHSPKSPHGP